MRGRETLNLDLEEASGWFFGGSDTPADPGELRELPLGEAPPTNHAALLHPRDGAAPSTQERCPRKHLGVGWASGEQLKFTEVSSHPVEQLEEAKGQRLEKVQFRGMTGEGRRGVRSALCSETKDARLQEGQVRGPERDQALL